MKHSEHVTLNLPIDLEQFVCAEAKRGAFASGADYIQHLIQSHYLKKWAQASLDAMLQKGLDDANTGRMIPLEEGIKRLRAALLETAD
jgi:predicted transcriptional regulator